MPNVLMAFEFFRGLEEDDVALEEARHLMSEKRFAPRETIVKEGDPSEEIFFLIDGKVAVTKLSKKGQVVRLANLSSSSYPFFGESAILGESQRGANVEAESACLCLVLKKADFEKFLLNHPKAGARICLNLARGLYHRVSKSDQDLLILSLYRK